MRKNYPNVILATIVLGTILMVAATGCRRSLDGDGRSWQAFSASPTWGQASLQVNFANAIQNEGWADAALLWDFGDGSTSSALNPNHTYYQPGRYSVSLQATGEGQDRTWVRPEFVIVTDNDVVAWNQAALQAIANAMWMPPQGARALAMLHTAMYDAVNCVEGTGAPYQADLAAPAGALKEAAAAQAAYRVLCQLFPAQTAAFDAQLALSLAAIPDGAGKSAGVALGESVAASIWASRVGDGSEMMMGPPYTGGTDPGEWRPTPPGYGAGIMPGWGMVMPFALTSSSQFRPGGPPELDDDDYAEAFAEVKLLGAKTSAARTMDQSMMATFWVGMPGTILEVGRMNQVVQQAAAAHHLGLCDSARLFALANVAMADAAIAGFDCKYHYSAWRPVTAIREADTDGNDDTAAAPAWEPYLTTPAHPEYISTHSALTTAATTILADFFGSDAADVTLPSFMDPMMTRHYPSFSAVSQEAGLSRIYGGIHFRFSFEDGTQLGHNVGQYVYDNVMLPL
jgi:PKD repeat protein